MKKYIVRVMHILCVFLLLSACADELTTQEHAAIREGVPVTVNLNLGVASSKIITRAAASDEAENTVNSVYVFAFNYDGSLDNKQIFTPSTYIMQDDCIEISFSMHSGSNKRIYAIGNPSSGSGSLTTNILAGIETEVSDCVMRDIWRKLLTNASLSTATALLMCSIDSLGRSSGAFSIVEKLLEEAVMVAAGDGYRFSYDEVRRELYEKTRTSHNAYTSIYSDLKNGRKTEVDYISGYVTARAEVLGLDVPYQRAAVDMIHAKEEISSIGC